ncbi:hypothetical protein DHW03_14175 [Pedobacter yonginense]|uniref:Uncharacterized protein n=1 Tax=Pedobacter yonginense TaxID=651869 RepID=A0A317EMM0_9SPHI|nr:hypothetical protein DHW03_14175 [Pedobacter yonginense]
MAPALNYKPDCTNANFFQICSSKSGAGVSIGMLSVHFQVHLFTSKFAGAVAHCMIGRLKSKHSPAYVYGSPNITTVNLPKLESVFFIDRKL